MNEMERQNEMELQTYLVAISNARLNISDAAHLITQALGDVTIVDVTLLMRAREKMGTARDQLKHLANDMTDDFCDDNDSDVDLHSYIGSYTDARGHKHVTRLGERKPDAQDAIDGLNEAWFAMRDEIRGIFDEFNSVVQSMHDKEGS